MQLRIQVVERRAGQRQHGQARAGLSVSAYDGICAGVNGRRAVCLQDRSAGDSAAHPASATPLPTPPACPTRPRCNRKDSLAKLRRRPRANGRGQRHPDGLCRNCRYALAWPRRVRRQNTFERCCVRRGDRQKTARVQMYDIRAEAFASMPASNACAASRIEIARRAALSRN